MYNDFELIISFNWNFETCFSSVFPLVKQKKMNKILLMNKFNEDISFFRFHWIEVLNYLDKVRTIMNVDLIIIELKY